jgi:hypothetical protein
MGMYTRKHRDRIGTWNTQGQEKVIVKLVRLNQADADYLAKVASEKRLSEAQFFRDLLREHQNAEPVAKPGKGKR